jgi:phosphopantothenoylcysteine decarboxylase / phosphopantothenate---cysteine ligase
MLLQGKKILLGVTGSIAAYKAAYLVRELVRSGADVRIILSPGAREFVGPLTFSTLSRNPVVSDFTADKETGEWNNHVEMGLWADLMLIAPLSANTLAKMASGQSDNVLLATYMSARCPVMIAPAMDLDMYLHPGTQANLKTLRSFGHLILEPAEGELASGLTGKGRMTEPSDILQAVIDHFHPALPLRGKKALVTAGPTFEKIDPVRFIGNYSTGKMGFALAEALANAGAEVELIAGPVHLTTAHPGVRRTNVESAREMLDAVQRGGDADIMVFAAAVADYRPAQQAKEKIKRSADAMTIVLEPNPDIAATMGARRREGQILVGFALETNNERAHAQSKLEKKNLDLIVMNSLQEEGAGFGTDTNKISLFWRNNKSEEFGLKAKSAVAKDIVNEIVKLLPA